MDPKLRSAEEIKRAALETDVRQRLYHEFELRFRDFFFPQSEADQRRLGKKIFLSLDLSTDEVLRIILGREFDIPAAPYSDTYDRIINIISAHKDKAFVHPFRTKTTGSLNGIKEPLSTGLSLVRAQNLLLATETHMMTPLDGVSRAVELTRVLDADGKVLHGEIWAGYKWKGLDFGTNVTTVANTALELPV